MKAILGLILVCAVVRVSYYSSPLMRVDTPLMNRVFAGPVLKKPPTTPKRPFLYETDQQVVVLDRKSEYFGCVGEVVIRLHTQGGNSYSVEFPLGESYWWEEEELGPNMRNWWRGDF